MSKYKFNISFETEISEDLEEEISEEEMVELLKNIFEKERVELLGFLEYELLARKISYKVSMEKKILKP